jgi:zinc protease
MRLAFWATIGMIAVFTLAGCKDEEGVFISPDGHKFAFLQRPDAEIVAVQLAFPMNWLQEDGNSPYVPQIAAEVMTTGGAEGYSPSEVLETIQDLDAQAFLYPQFYTLRGGLNVAPAQLDQAVTLANAVLRAPSFDETWMQRSMDTLRANAVETHNATVFQGLYALRLAMMGDTVFTEASLINNPSAIADVTVQHARDWHSQTLVTGSAVIAVAGPINLEKAGQVVDNLLNGLPHADTAFAEPPTAPYKARKILMHNPLAEKTTLVVISPIPPTGGLDDFSDPIAAGILAGDDQSVLFREIRTQLRATYGFAAGPENYSRKARIFTISGDVETAQTAAAHDLVMRIYSDMSQNLMDAAEVARFKSAISLGFDDLHNNTTQLATSMVEFALDGQDPMTITELGTLLDRVSPPSIKDRWATHYAKPENVTTLVVSPDAGALAGACVITQARQVLDCP